jgi:hypothetical protein
MLNPRNKFIVVSPLVSMTLFLLRQVTKDVFLFLKSLCARKALLQLQKCWYINYEEFSSKIWSSKECCFQGLKKANQFFQNVTEISFFPFISIGNVCMLDAFWVFLQHFQNLGISIKCCVFGHLTRMFDEKIFLVRAPFANYQVICAHKC